MKYIFLAIFLACPAYSQTFPANPYGSSAGSSSGGGGGGGVGGTINAAPQFEVPYYSVAGTTTTLSGSSAFYLYTSSAVYSGSSGFFANGNGGLTSGGLLYLGNANPIGDPAGGEIAVTSFSEYSIYLGASYLGFNSQAGTPIHLTSGGNNAVYVFSPTGGLAGLGVNAGGCDVTGCVFTLEGGNASLSYDQNSTTEFFIRNTNSGANSDTLWDLSNGTNEGFIELGGSSASGLTLPLQANVFNMYSKQNSPIRLSTKLAQPIDFWTNSLPAMVITSSQTVGIGTTAPGADFEVRSSTSQSQYAIMISSQNAVSMFDVEGNGNVDIHNVVYAWPASQGGATTYLQNDGSGNLSWASVGSGSPGSTNGAVQFNSSGSFGGDASNLYWDDSDGRLGIGTTVSGAGAPLNILSPNGGAMVVLHDTSVGANGAYIYLASDAGNGALIFTGASFATKWGLGDAIGTGDPGSYNFYVYNYALSGENLTIVASSGLVHDWFGMKIDGALSVAGGANTYYRCVGGTNDGAVNWKVGGPCPAGTNTATSLSTD